MGPFPSSSSRGAPHPRRRQVTHLSIPCTPASAQVLGKNIPTLTHPGSPPSEASGRPPCKNLLPVGIDPASQSALGQSSTSALLGHPLGSPLPHITSSRSFRKYVEVAHSPDTPSNLGQPLCLIGSSGRNCPIQNVSRTSGLDAERSTYRRLVDT